VFGGPFVMNSELEIAEAYRDFHAGKYGEMSYGGKTFCLRTQWLCESAVDFFAAETIAKNSF